MPVLLTKMEQYVIDELKRRQQLTVPNQPSRNDLLWSHGRTPWIKMQSNVAFEDDNPNAKYDYETKYILYSGWLNNSNNSPFASAYSSANEFRPFPAIEDINVSIKGALGMMREVKVKFKVYTLNQLEILQVLYMTPGIGVLVEWGWSVPDSVLSSIVLKKQPVPNDDNRWLRKTIQERIAQGKGFYDALFGLCSDFSISVTDDGSWDCETTIVGPGAMTVDINLQSPGNALGDKLSDYFDDAVRAELDNQSISDTRGDRLRVGKVKGIEKQTSVTQTDSEQDKEKKGDPSLKPVDVKASNIYVTWDFIEIVLNKFFNDPVAGAAGNVAGAKFIDSFPDEPPFIIPCFRWAAGKYPKFRSLSPSAMLIPNNPPEFDKKAFDQPNPQRNLQPFAVSEKSPTVGDFSSVWINYNSVLKDKFKNKDNIREALNEILGWMNDASGGLWDLRLMFDEGFRFWRVVDVRGADGDSTSDTAFAFNLNRIDSIVREASVTMNVPNALKATVMIASNAPVGNVYSSVAERDKVGVIKSLTSGVQDRFAREMMKKSTPGTTDSRNKKGNPYFEALDNLEKQPYYYEPSGKEKDAYINHIFDRLELMKQREDFNQSVLIPLELSVTIDGIGGIKWGNAFTVRYLPQRYITNALFQVKDISHTVSQDGWTTTIVGLMRPGYKPRRQMPNINPSTQDADIRLAEIVVEGEK